MQRMYYIYIIVKQSNEGQLNKYCGNNMKTTDQFLSIDWKEVKSLLDSSDFKAIGTNYHQVNNQGEYTINKEGTKIYKRRHTAVKSHYDLIANKSNNNETGTFVVSTPNENHFFVTLKEAKQDFEDGGYEMKKLKISGEIILFQLPTIPDFDEREMYEYFDECLSKSLEEIIAKEEI